jgi:hypothetical protein
VRFLCSRLPRYTPDPVRALSGLPEPFLSVLLGYRRPAPHPGHRNVIAGLMPAQYSHRHVPDDRTEKTTPGCSSGPLNSSGGHMIDADSARGTWNDDEIAGDGMRNVLPGTAILQLRNGTEPHSVSSHLVLFSSSPTSGDYQPLGVSDGGPSRRRQRPEYSRPRLPAARLAKVIGTQVHL